MYDLHEAGCKYQTNSTTDQWETCSGSLHANSSKHRGASKVNVMAHTPDTAPCTPSQLQTCIHQSTRTFHEWATRTFGPLECHVCYKATGSTGSTSHRA